MTSPSLGITSPADTTHSSSTCSCALGTSSIAAVGRRRWAIVSERVLRSVSACALPRPSAIASAKFANSTVNQRNSGDEPGEDVLVRGRRAEVAEEEDRGEHAADRDDEHHRVARHARAG